MAEGLKITTAHGDAFLGPPGQAVELLQVSIMTFSSAADALCYVVHDGSRVVTVSGPALANPTGSLLGATQNSAMLAFLSPLKRRFPYASTLQSHAPKI